MDAVIRVAVLYILLLALFRLAGKRTLSEATTFDLLLILVISETTQQALVDDDHSFTHSILLILTFVAMNVGLSWWKQRSKWVEKLLEGTPVLLVENGKYLHRVMDKVRVDEDDILEAARERQGLTSVEEIRFAVLERTGRISVVPLAQS